MQTYRVTEEEAGAGYAVRAAAVMRKKANQLFASAACVSLTGASEAQDFCRVLEKKARECENEARYQQNALSLLLSEADDDR